MEKRVLCLVTGLSLIICVASSVTPYDPDSEYEVPHTKFRDKRTLDFILRGLANILGYRLERDNGGAKPTAAAIVTAKPTTTTAAPAKVLLLNVADIVEKTRKNNAAKSTTPKPCKQEYQNYHYKIQSTEKPHIENYHYNIQSTEKPHIETYNRLHKYSYTSDVPTKGNLEEYKKYGYTLDPEAKSKPGHVDNHGYQNNYQHFELESDHTGQSDEGDGTKERDGRKPNVIPKDSPDKHHSQDHYTYHDNPYYTGHHDEGRKPAPDERHHSHGYYGYQDDGDNHGHYKQDKPSNHGNHNGDLKGKQKGTHSEKDTSEKHHSHHDDDEREKPAHTEKETSERHHNRDHPSEYGHTGDHHHSDKHQIRGYNVHLEHGGYPEHVVHFKVDLPYYGHDYSTQLENAKQRQHQHLLKDEHKAPEDDYVSKEIATRGKEDEEDKREHYDHPSDSYGNLRWGQEAFFRDKEGDKENAHVLDEYNVIPSDYWGGNWLEGYSFGVQENPKSSTRVTEKESGRSVTTVSGIVITELGPKKKHRENEEEQYTTTLSGADGDPTTTTTYHDGGTTTLSREEYRDSPTVTPEKIIIRGTEPSPMPVLSTYRPKLVQTLHEGTGDLLPPSPFDDEHAGRHGGGDFSVVGKLTRASQKVVASPLPFLVSVYNRSSVSDVILDNKPKKGYVGLAIPNSKPEAAIQHPNAPPEPSFYGVVLPRKWLQSPTKRTPEKVVVQEKNNTTKTASVGVGVRVQVNKSREFPPSLIRVAQGLGKRPAYRDALDIPLDELQYPGRETQHVVAVQNPTPVAIPYHPTPPAQEGFQAHDHNSEFLRALQFPYHIAAPTASSPQEYQIQSHFPDGNRDFLRALQLPYHPTLPTQNSQQQFRLVVPDHQHNDDHPFRIVISS